MRLDLAIRGDLERIMQDERRAAERAVIAGVREAGGGLQDSLRQQVRSAGLGDGVARARRLRFFENQRLDAAALVHSTAPTIIRAFDEGVTIASHNGIWLAIPTENAPRRGVGGKRISPSTFPEHRFGPLRFVYRPGKPALLVVDGLRASFRRATGEQRGFRRASARARERGETTTVVMFVLVPQVSLPKRLDVDREATRWADRLPSLIAQSWPAPEGER